MGPQLTYKLGDLSIPKTKHFLPLNNNTCEVKNTKKGLVKLLVISFLSILDGRNENLCQQNDLSPFVTPDRYAVL